jgi:drug/metabolite transporter (DMT)-like permease
LPTQIPQSKVPAAAAIGFAVTVWGASFVAARHLLDPGPDGRPALDPITLAAARFTLASLFFLGPFAAELIRRRVCRRDLLRMALLGQIAFSTYFWLQYTGVQKTSAGIAAILVIGLTPSAAALLSRFGGESRLTLTAWGGLLLGFLGVAVIVLNKPAEVSAGSDFLVGALCLVGNAFAFAVYSILSRRWMKELRPLTLTAGTMIFGTMGLALLSFTISPGGWHGLTRLDAVQWSALLYLSIACSVAGFFAWNFALSRIEASRAMVCLYAEPVVAMILGAALLGERYGWTAFAGAAAIALSVALVTRAGRSV